MGSELGKGVGWAEVGVSVGGGQSDAEVRARLRRAEVVGGEEEGLSVGRVHLNPPKRKLMGGGEEEEEGGL